MELLLAIVLYAFFGPAMIVEKIFGKEAADSDLLRYISSLLGFLVLGAIVFICMVLAMLL